MRAAPLDWALLLSLAVLWGSSYSLVAVALRSFRPPEIAALRILAGALVLLVAMVATRTALPRTRRAWLLCAAIAVVGNCLPFFLISWGQQHLESALAGILAAVTPLCVLLMAHFILHDERLERRQIGAFLLGFLGVVVLMGPDSLAGLGGSGLRLAGQLAVFAAAACYALATVLARLMPPDPPMATSGAVLLVASGLMAPLGLPVLPALPAAPPPALAALGILGALGTGFAAILYFRLIGRAGARFASLLNYLVPLWAAALGILLLGERLSWNAWLALALILGAVLATQSTQSADD